MGRARYDLEPRPASFLAVRLAESAEILWASVDGVIEPALRDGPGQWLVPLGDRNARQVIVCWRAPPIVPLQARPERLACPTIDQADVPTLISITAPDSVEVASTGLAEKINRSNWEAEVAEQVASRVVGALSDLDRSSRRDREQVLDDLVEIELKDRSLVRGPTGSTPRSRGRPGPTPGGPRVDRRREPVRRPGRPDSGGSGKGRTRQSGRGLG